MTINLNVTVPAAPPKVTISTVGLQGPVGPVGASGTNGTNGTNGINGTNGATGFPASYAEAYLGNPSNGNVTAATIATGSFIQVPLTTEVSDPGNSFDPATGKYTVPATGTYLIVAKLRLKDTGQTAGLNFGFGVHTALADNTAFQWQTTVGPPSVTGSNNREVYNYQRLGQFNAGDALQMLAYADGASLLIAVAQFSIIRIA